MPCQDDGQSAYYAKLDRDRLDRVTQFLCYMCGTFAPNGANLPSELVSWWENHQIDDAKRVERKMDEMICAPSFKMGCSEDLAAWFIEQARKVHPVSRYHHDWFYAMAAEAWKRNSNVFEKRKERARAIAKLSASEREALGL